MLTTSVTWTPTPTTETNELSSGYDALTYNYDVRLLHVVLSTGCPLANSTGKERDPESGLDYFGVRYFSAGYGRFVLADQPFSDQESSDPQSWNLYAYVRNNPLRHVDPNGQGAWDVIKGIAQGGANFVVNTVIGVAQVVAAVGQDGGQVGYNTTKLFAEPIAVAVEEYKSKGASGVANEVLDQGEQGATAIVTEAVLTGGLGATSRVNSIKPVSGVQANRAAGLNFEGQVLENEGLAKNTTPIKAVDPKTGTTIPDAIRPNGQTVDVKAGRTVSDSPQLRRQSQISAQSGQKGQVIISKKTKGVSPSVQQRMEVRRYPE